MYVNVWMYTHSHHNTRCWIWMYESTCAPVNTKTREKIVTDQHNFLHTILFLLLFLKCSTREIDAIFSFKTILPSYVWHRMLEMLLHFTTHDNQITIVQCYIFHHFSTCFWMKHKASCATKRVGKDGDIHLMLWLVICMGAYRVLWFVPIDKDRVVCVAADTAAAAATLAALAATWSRNFPLTAAHQLVRQVQKLINGSTCHNCWRLRQ